MFVAAGLVMLPLPVNAAQGGEPPPSPPGGEVEFEPVEEVEPLELVEEVEELPDPVPEELPELEPESDGLMKSEAPAEPAPEGSIELEEEPEPDWEDADWEESDGDEEEDYVDVVPIPQLPVHMGTLIAVGDRSVPSFNVDVELAVRLMIANSKVSEDLYAVVRPAVAYGHDTHPHLQGHRFIAGLGLGAGSLVAAGYVMPSFVYAGADGLGVRTALRGDLGFGLLTLEVSHQWLQGGSTPGPSGHAVRVMLGIDVGLLLGGALLIAGLNQLGKAWR